MRKREFIFGPAQFGGLFLGDMGGRVFLKVRKWIKCFFLTENEENKSVFVIIVFKFSVYLF